MDMPLSTTEVVYSIVQQTLNNSDPNPPQELHIFLEPIWAQESLTSHDTLDLVFPSDKVILEAMTGPYRLWDDLNNRAYFLPEDRRVEAIDFITTMNGDVTHRIIPLEMHRVYVEGNMGSIAETIPIDMSKTHGIVENIFIGAYFPPKDIQVYTELFK